MRWAFLSDTVGLTEHPGPTAKIWPSVLIVARHVVKKEGRGYRRLAASVILRDERLILSKDVHFARLK